MKNREKLISERLKIRREELGLTYEDIANYINVNKTTVMRYEKGTINKIAIDKLILISEILETTPEWLMCLDENKINYQEINNIIRLNGITHKVPLLNKVSCGLPKYAEEDIQYINLLNDTKADFCLQCDGDSMEPKLFNGDIAFIRSQPYVENGEIACVLIEDEATLKRLHYTNDMVMLIPENQAYKPIVFTKNSNKNIKILGKLVAIQRSF